MFPEFCKFLHPYLVMAVVNKFLGKVLVLDILTAEYAGWLMSDGLMNYRIFSMRLRCWAHLIRKAKGLSTSLDKDSKRFGNRVLELLEFMVKEVKDGPDPPILNLFWRRSKNTARSFGMMLLPKRCVASPLSFSMAGRSFGTPMRNLPETKCVPLGLSGHGHYGAEKGKPSTAITGPNGYLTMVSLSDYDSMGMARLLNMLKPG